MRTLMLTDDGVKLAILRPGELATLQSAARLLAQALLDAEIPASTTLAPSAFPTTAEAAPAEKTHRRGRTAKPARAAKRAASPAPAAGNPCTVCGGPVDRSGCGGYKRTVCATCKQNGKKPAPPPTRRVRPVPEPETAMDRKARIAAALARVDKMSPEERNARAAAAEAQEAGA